MSVINFNLNDEYLNALNKEADKESRLFSISLLNWTHPLDSLVLDDDEDLDIRIAALDCLDLFKLTLYEIDIDKVPKELALAVIERLDSLTVLREIALNHSDSDFRLKALENKYLKDEETLKHIIENDSLSKLRVAAAKHPSLNDSGFLENLALNDDDVYVRQSAVSNYSTSDIPTLKKIISDDEDIVRISALDNLVFKFNLFYPYSNKKYNFKKRFDKISWTVINYSEDYIPNGMNDDEMHNLMDFDLLDSIYFNSVNENYMQLKDNLIKYYEKNLAIFEKYNPFNEKEEDGSFKKKVFDDFNLEYGDIRRLFLYQMAYDDGYANLKYGLDNLNDIAIDSQDFKSSDRESSCEKQIDESYFIDLAYEDSNDEIVRLAIEAISDNSVLMDFIKNGKTRDIIKTAIKRSTDLPSLVDLAVNQIDRDIHEFNFYDEDLVCDYALDNLEDSQNNFENFFGYDFYIHDLSHYERLFDNRLESFYFDEIAEFYYMDALSFCLFRKIQNFFDLIYVLKNTRSFALRDLIIYKIKNPVVLADIALNAIDERIRYIAFGRIESKDVLKYVYLNTEDFRIKFLYLSNIDDNDILNGAFLNEDNDVLLRSILDNDHFNIGPEVIEHCINEESYISSYAENKFAKQFVNFRLMNKKFLR